MNCIQNNKFCSKEHFISIQEINIEKLASSLIYPIKNLLSDDIYNKIKYIYINQLKLKRQCGWGWGWGSSIR